MKRMRRAALLLMTRSRSTIQSYALALGAVAKWYVVGCHNHNDITGCFMGERKKRPPKKTLASSQ
jgi:hypothetical protein